MLSTIDPHHPYATCGGPSRGCPYCIAIFSESPQRQYERTQAEDRARRLRVAAERDYTPPDPYEKDLASMRLSVAQAAAAHQPSPRSTEMHLDANGIPDPYFHALERMRTNR